MLIDTHAHLWWDSYESDLDAVIERAKKAGVEKIIVPGTNIESSKMAVELAKKYPGIIYAAVGIHPEEILENTLKVRPSANGLSRGWAHPLRSDLESAVAIGEIGIDLYTEEIQKTLPEQKVLFREQCLLALEFELPVIIHTRNSFAETWEVLESLPEMPKGQFHCFSVDEEALKMVIEHGFYVSFGGNITWSKRVARLVSLVPGERLLLETDSPLMVPRDKDGKPVNNNERNEPANVRILAEKIADLRGVSIQEIEDATTMNAKTLYRL